MRHLFSALSLLLAYSHVLAGDTNTAPAHCENAPSIEQGVSQREPPDRTRLPTLTAIEAMSLAQKYVTDHVSGIDGYKITGVRYSYKLHLWSILFESDSLVIGEGDFSVQVSDRNPKDISVRPSL
jgi:hypothetical protein